MSFVLLFAALTWYPATNWVERPDPVASPYARKGGTLRFSGGQPPKSYNAYVDGSAYVRMTFSLMYDGLLGVDPQTLDFAPALARRWAVADDGEEFVFELDPRARWSDGTPVTAADVKATFDAVLDPKSDTGAWKIVLAAFESPTIVGERVVRIRKRPGSARDWRDLMNCGMFPVLPARFLATDGFNRLDFLGAPVSGAYRFARVNEQVEAEFARVETWWRRDAPSCRGTCNFDRIILRYYADNENAFEAFKKRAIDVYPVYTARLWAEETKGEKFARNWILRRCVRNHRPVGFQGFAMNMRRRPFNDRRVREAMACLIDRETMNRTMMNGAYYLQNSYFQDVYDTSTPCTNELYRFDIPRAQALLKAAGLEKGFEFTFLSRSGTEDKFLALFDQALRRCHIRMHIVRKDFAGWMRDMDGFNYDMTWAAWGAGVFKSPETMWLSTEADRAGSNNIVGFRSAEVDRLIAEEKRMSSASDRLAAYRQIDALLAAECPYALLWNTDSTRLLYWNKFGAPPTILPRHGDEEGVLTYWWYDEDRALELRESISGGGFLPHVPEEVVYDERAPRAADKETR